MSYSDEVLADTPLTYYRLNESVTVSVTATGSSNWPGEEPARAFDNNLATTWTTNGTSSGWLQAQLSTAAVLTEYSIRGRDDIPGRNPRDWAFEGSNDGSTWAVLDTRSGITFATGEIRAFSFTNTTAYLYYRLNVSANNGDVYLNVAELGSSVWSARLTDSSGNNRHGSYAIPPASVPGLLVGDSDTAVNFPGTNPGTNSAVVPYASWMNVANVTLEIIAKPAALNGNLWDRDNEGSSRIFQFMLAGGKLQFLFWTVATGPFFCNGATTLSVGREYHLAATFDGTTARVYVDGVEDGSLAVSGDLRAGTNFGLGLACHAGANGVQAPNAVLDEAAYYGSVLSPSRIAAHYAAATTASGPADVEITLDGHAPAATATFDLSRTLPVREVTLAGTAPAASATFALDHADPAPPVNEVTFAAIAPAATASLDLAHFAPFDLTFAATAPAASALLLIEVPSSEPTITFAAVAPAAVVAFTLVGPLTTTTDLTSDVSEGYNYDGESDVLDDGTTGSIPAGIRLAPIRFVHQSVPAPVLVKGRPQ